MIPWERWERRPEDPPQGADFRHFTEQIPRSKELSDIHKF